MRPPCGGNLDAPVPTCILVQPGEQVADIFYRGRRMMEGGRWGWERKRGGEASLGRDSWSRNASGTFHCCARGGTDSQEERVTSLLGRQLCRRNLSIGLLCCPPPSISPSASPSSSLPHPRHHPLLPSHGSPPAGCSGAPRVSSMGCWTTTTRRSWPRAHGNKP